MRIYLLQIYGLIQPLNVEPLSVEVLASYIKSKFPNCEIDLEIISKQNLADQFVYKKIVNRGFDLIGISIPQGTLQEAFFILDEIESLFPCLSKKPIILLGHAIPTHYPEIFLKKYPWAVCVNGWGEVPLEWFVKNGFSNDHENVPGIHYIQGDIIRSNALAKPVQPKSPCRVDSAAFFNRFESSRGCSYRKCTYCLHPQVGLYERNQWYRMPISQTLSAIEELKDNGIREFTFTDEDFYGSMLDDVYNLAQGMQKIGGMKFSLSAMIDDFYSIHNSDVENKRRIKLLEMLKKAGLSLVYCGLESISSSQLRRYGKRTKDINALMKGIRIAKEIGVELEIGYILFDPFVTIEELNENINNLEKTGIWKDIKSIVSIFNVYINTPYKTWLENEGLLRGFNPNLLSYDWKFNNSEVEEVALACFFWREKYHEIYTYLRHIQRTDLAASFIQPYLENFRYQDLHFVKYSLLKYQNNTGAKIEMSKLNLQRMKLLTDLIKELEGTKYLSSYKEKISTLLDNL